MQTNEDNIPNEKIACSKCSLTDDVSLHLPTEIEEYCFSRLRDIF